MGFNFCKSKASIGNLQIYYRLKKDYFKIKHFSKEGLLLYADLVKASMRGRSLLFLRQILDVVRRKS